MREAETSLSGKGMGESLTAIANRHGTDKGTQGPKRDWEGLNYTDLYEAYLGGLRDAKITLLEIGLGVSGERWRAVKAWGGNQSTGGSLRMWYTYFPGAQIFGLDVNPASHLDNDRTRTFVADQGDIRDLQSFMSAIGDVSFDVIIDDGSHRPDHQQIALGFFFKRLKSSGLYFIEDLMANGRGDPPMTNPLGNTIATDTVLNTRNVIKSYFDNGSFASPNALNDTNYLAEQIEYGSLHAPEQVLALRRGTIRPFQPLMVKRHYRQGSESLCVLRKR